MSAWQLSGRLPATSSRYNPGTVRRKTHKPPVPPILPFFFPSESDIFGVIFGPKLTGTRMSAWPSPARDPLDTVQGVFLLFRQMKGSLVLVCCPSLVPAWWR